MYTDFYALGTKLYARKNTQDKIVITFTEFNMFYEIFVIHSKIIRKYLNHY